MQNNLSINSTLFKLETQNLKKTSKITGPIIFLLLNDVNIQFILEFKNSFGKYHPVFPKSFFWISNIKIHNDLFLN